MIVLEVIEEIGLVHHIDCDDFLRREVETRSVRLCEFIFPQVLEVYCRRQNQNRVRSNDTYESLLYYYPDE